MANFDLSSLALKMIAPTNTIITDDKGLPGAYVQCPKIRLCDLLDTEDTTIHPAFRVNGAEVPSIYIGKYMGVAHNSRLYSLPAEVPTGNITWANNLTYCSNKGTGHHMITAAEWAYLALWSKKNGTLPLGNCDYGKDTTETEYIAIPGATDSSTGKTTYTLSGTGPLTWSHNHQADGIMDLKGNKQEWLAGIRTVYTELQVIPDNNAADSSISQSASSSEWKAINAAATSWDDLYITPNGSGTTSSSVKFNASSYTWQTSTPDTGTSAPYFYQIKADSSIGDIAKLYLQSMALLPEDGATAADYGNCGILNWYTTGSEYMLRRGGFYNNGAVAGVFGGYCAYARSYASVSNGGSRPAFLSIS